jgi:hypothetical protein
MFIRQSRDIQEVFYEQMAESGMLGGLGKIISTGKSGLMDTLSATYAELDFYSGSSLKQTWTMR